MKQLKSVLAIMLCAVLALTLFAGCRITIGNGDIVILFTGDAANEANAGVGFSSVAAYKRAVSTTHDFVALVDCGNSLSGGSMDLVSKGEFAAKIMNEAGYRFCALGSRDAALGSDAVSASAELMGAKLLSANVLPDDDELKIEAYATEVFAGRTVAFVGATGSMDAPDFDISSGDEMISDVQAAVDEAKKKSDFVVILSNIGSNECEKLISKVSGVCAVLDAGSEPVAERHIKDKDGADVIYSSAGSKLQSIGQLIISAGGTVTATNVTYTEKDEDLDLIIKTMEEGYSAKLKETFVTLSQSIPETNDAGVRTLENRETAIGNLVADAYAKAAGADIALVTATEISAGLDAGDVTLESVLNALPRGGDISTAEVTGSQIADALEFSVRNTAGYYAQNGVPYGTFEGFLQVSGISFTVSTYFASTVSESEEGEFEAVGGTRRVSNIRVKNSSGEYEELDNEKTYTVAGSTALLSGKLNGYSMFGGAKVSGKSETSDYNALLSMLKESSAEELAAYHTVGSRITVR